MPMLIVYGLMALAILGTIGTGVHYVKKWGGDEVRAEWDKANEAARKREAEASAKAAADLAAERKKRKIVTVERTIYVDKNIEKLVDSGKCFTPAGVLCVNSAIDGKGTTGCVPDSGVPAAKPAN